MNSILDSDTRHLVRLSAGITGADEQTVRGIIDQVVTGHVAPELVDEVILQSYLFAGFPRTLNAARMWRSVSGVVAPSSDESASSTNTARWKQQGESTCAIVYGRSYEMLRKNVRGLHPALDAWMITDGYGKILSRPGLDLKRRELSIAANADETAPVTVWPLDEKVEVTLNGRRLLDNRLLTATDLKPGDRVKFDRDLIHAIEHGFGRSLHEHERLSVHLVNGRHTFSVGVERYLA